jgi:hypothetical protein
LLPQLGQAWQERNKRPLPESVQFTLSKFERIWIAESSTLEALFRKLKSLADVPKGQLAGKMGIVIDLMNRLPVEIWFQENPRASDTKLEANLLSIEVRSGKIWYSYLTSVLDPTVLSPYVVADLYRRRWRIEEAFNTVKRLLGLSDLWTGSLNGIQLQIWGTWLFYAVLVDLGDAVADELSFPFDRISLEMIYRGLYHFYVAHQKGLASDPVKYFAAPENQDLGVVKQQQKPNVKLIVAPFPDRQRSPSEFFFTPFSQTPLTTGIQA